MNVLGNMLWFLIGGLIGGTLWIIAGVLWCLTIVGIPVGMQCFKFSKLAFFPFGKRIIYGKSNFSFLLNVIWIVFSGFELCTWNLLIGCLCYITIIGIPFGKQFFKLARLSLLPFGAEVI